MSTAAATQAGRALIQKRRFSPASFGLGAGFVSLLIGAVGWELIGRVWDVYFSPPLSDVLVRLVELTAPNRDITRGVILNNLLQSLINLSIGFGVSLVFGILIGALMGAYPKIGSALDIYVYALLTA